MNLRVRVTEQAFADMHKATLWYEEKQPNLGERFTHELERYYGVLETRPLLGRSVKGNIRRVVMSRFPYEIFYAYNVQEGTIYVLVIHHSSQNPKSWQDRIL